MIHRTTVLGIIKGGKTVFAGDGQVTVGTIIMKSKAKKIRRLYQNKVLAGFAGSTADAFALFEKFEAKLNEFSGEIIRASVELAKDWRMDRALRRLEALLLVSSRDKLLLVSGSGDVIECEDEVMAIGSGGSLALSSAKALIRHTKMDIADIARTALEIAADIDLYTNKEIIVETL